MSKRLSGYDYSQPGFYFVTICTQQHRRVWHDCGWPGVFERPRADGAIVLGHVAQTVCACQIGRLCLDAQPHARHHRIDRPGSDTR